MKHLGLIDIVVIGLYMLGMIAVGWWCSRRQRTTEEYFVAERGMHPFLAGISIIATLLSTVSYLTIPGEMIKNGPGLMWGTLHFPLTFLIVGYFIIPYIMKTKVTSAYELLEQRFGSGIRKSASGLFILVRIPWMAFIIYTCSYAVATAAGIPFPYLLFIIGICTTIYAVMGGIRAVVLTDVIQFVILVGGGLLAVAYITVRCGGFSWWPAWGSPQLADLHWPTVKVFSLNPFDRITAISAVWVTTFWWVCTAASDQVVIQRYLCTRNAVTARRSFLHCLVGDLVIGIVLWGIGIALLGYFMKFTNQLPDAGLSIVQQSDKLFPYFIATILPGGLSGLVIAALLAAAMSSLSSGINSITTVLMTDFKDIFDGGRCSEKTLLRRAKIIGIILGLTATGLSFVLGLVPGGNLLEVGYRIGEFFAAPLFVLFAMAFFVPFSTPAGGWAAVAGGFFSGVLFSYWKQIVGYFVPTNDFSVILILPASVLVSLTMGLLVSAITKPRILCEPVVTQS